MKALASRRIVVLIVLAALFVSAALVGKRRVGVTEQLAPPATDTASDSPQPPTPGLTDADAVVPTAAHAGAFSTTWYCVGGSGAAEGTAPGVLELMNRGQSAVTAVLRGVGSDGATVERAVDVGSATTLAQPLADLLPSALVSVVVEARGADLTVAQRFTSPAGSGVAPCATRAATQWYFAGGSTDRGANEQLVVFNPFPDPATVDVTYFLPDGLRRPEKAQGIPVAGHSTVVVRVGDTQDRVAMLGAAVTTRTGRVIAARLQSFDGTGELGPTGQPPKGVSLALGSPWAATAFVLPDGLINAGLASQIMVTNPGPNDSRVRLDFTLDQPELNGQPTPIEVDVPAHSWKLLGPTELRQLPLGVPFMTRGTVTSGGPVVAELWEYGNEPAAGHGVSSETGVAVAATDWVVPLRAPSSEPDRLTIASGGKAARVTFSIVAGGKRSALTLPETTPTRVAAAARLSIDLRAALAAHPDAVLLVHADAPVVVARSWFEADAAGLPLLTAYPVGDTITELAG